MKILVFILLLAFIVFLSCSKNGSTPANGLFQQLQAHEWIFDSQRISYNSEISMGYPESGTKQTTVFTKDTLLYYYQFADNHIDTTAYQLAYEQPDKVYWWLFGSHKNPQQFLAIDTVDEHNLIYHYNIVSETVVVYYHSK